MLMTLNSLVVVHTKLTTKTVKQITRFLNYRATHPDTVTEYRRNRMILHIYLDESYIPESEARSRAGGYFFLGIKSNTPIQSMSPYNVPVHVE